MRCARGPINIKAAHFPAPPLDPLRVISDGAVLLALLFLSQGVLMNQTSSLDRSSPSFSTKPCVIFGCFPLNLFIHTVMCRSFSSFLSIFVLCLRFKKRKDRNHGWYVFAKKNVCLRFKRIGITVGMSSQRKNICSMSSFRKEMIGITVGMSESA